MLKRIISIVLLAIGLNACQTEVSPTEEVQLQVEQHTFADEAPNQEVTQRSVASARKWIIYRCNKKKLVKIQERISQQKGKKIIALNFNDTQHTLSATVTRNGEKYSNIRWTWQKKRNGIATLRDNSGKILADNCKKEG